ncbi:MAG: glycosyltransferase family 1 protein [Planctomycetota bacterium]
MTRAPRVLVSGVVLGQPMGGVRRHNAELLPRAARLLAERGGALDVLEGSRPIAFDLPPEARRVPSAVPPGPPLPRVLREGQALRDAAAAAAAAGRAYDLVHTAHLPVPRSLPLAYTLTVHDLRALLLRGAPFARRLIAGPVLGAAVRGAARVLTVSETVREQLVGRFPLPTERVTVVPNGADHFEPLPRNAGPGAPLLHVGHLEPRKNVELLLRALAADAELPGLVLAGAAKPGERERLEAFAKELDVHARVRFLGAFDEADLPRLYATAACVVVPSHVEGFGLAVPEAQRALCPLAIADAGALPEVAGPDAPRFAPDDVAGCVRAVRAALARDAAELAREREHAQGFGWEDSAVRLVEAWTEAASPRN